MTSPDLISQEARKRRTFAIISHPDAGKTTLTEKLLLYGGAVVEAGSVDGRKDRKAATSDWMEMEQRRGISVSSTVMRFEYRNCIFNLLDTPGHSDFSEDTLRVMSAVDSAVILIDAAKGVESQTLRLFEVARSRGIPLLTFINKCDRPGIEPLEMIDHIETTLDLMPVPLTWPVGIPGQLEGVVDRRSRMFHRIDRTPGGRSAGVSEVIPVDDAADSSDEAWGTALDELELLEGAGNELDPEGVANGISTPVFFGSALTNFGVELLLDSVIEMAPSPMARVDTAGEPRSLTDDFSALVFKVQANMDPRHRDRNAFLRICSGRFERGMKVINQRTGRPVALNYSSDSFGRKRDTMDEGFPGDIVGIVNAADTQVGDTLHQGTPVEFPPLPTLVPEHFISVRNREATKHKQFHKGLSQLSEEGVIHLLHRDGGRDPEPVLGAVGRLQFEVAIERLDSEFGVEVRVDELPWKLARRTDEDGAALIGNSSHVQVRTRSDGTLFALFKNQFEIDRLERQHPELRLDHIV